LLAILPEKANFEKNKELQPKENPFTKDQRRKKQIYLRTKKKSPNKI